MTSSRTTTSIYIAARIRVRVVLLSCSPMGEFCSHIYSLYREFSASKHILVPLRKSILRNDSHLKVSQLQEVNVQQRILRDFRLGSNMSSL
jgi:hypothetical protein